MHLSSASPRGGGGGGGESRYLRRLTFISNLKMVIVS